MSRNGDTRRILHEARAAGLDVTKEKHGGYAVRDSDGTVLCRVPANGNGPRHWIRNARKAIRT